MTGNEKGSINVTPLIDVLLVLLVIFMVVMPLMVRKETIELPPETKGDISEAPAIVLKLRGDLTVAVDDGAPLGRRDALGVLRGRVRTAGAVFVDTDDDVPWGEVVEVVDEVRGLADDAEHEGIRVAVRLRPEGEVRAAP